MTDTTGREPSVRWWAQEDWLAVFVGVLLLAAISLGILPALPALKWGGAIGWTTPWAPAVLTPWLMAGALACLLTMVAVRWQGGAVRPVAAGFAVVFALAWLSMLLAGHVTAAAWGLEYVIFALVIGLVVGHTVGAPPWLQAAARTEFFIKPGSW